MGVKVVQEKLSLRIDKFSGVNLLVKDARTKPGEAVETLNLYQVEDGIWSPRPGTHQFGSNLSGDENSIINGATEFVSTNQSGSEIRTIISVIDGVPYSSNDACLTWKKIPGATFNNKATVRFLQLGGLLYIFNGIDPLAIYNGTNLMSFVKISPPTGFSFSLGSGLVDGSYTQSYFITAINRIGETSNNERVIVKTSKPRDLWEGKNNELINLSWRAVDGAIAYRVYWSALPGEEQFLAQVSTNSYKDDGATVVNDRMLIPDENTTSAPVFASAWVSDNAIYATNDRNFPYRVYRTGTGKNVGRFSSFFDGFYIDLEDGGREKPKTGKNYQTGQGEGRSTVFCSTPEGRGSVWQISAVSHEVAGISFVIPQAYKITGSVGTDAIDGVINVETDVFFPNKHGVYALGPEKQYFGILRTNNLATLVIEYWRSLPGNKIKDIASYYWNGKVLISVSTDGKENNRTIIYDRERLRWYVDWSIGFKQFFEFTDKGGTSHLLAVPEKGNRLIEISDKIRGDMGVPFKCVYMSGRIPIDGDWTRFAKVKKAYIKLGRPRGAINFSVYGTQKKKGYTALASRTITSSLSASGFGWDLLGTNLFGDTSGRPEIFSESSEIKYLKVNKKLRDIQFRVESNSLSSEFTILSLQAKGFKINSGDSSTWKLKKS